MGQVIDRCITDAKSARPFTAFELLEDSLSQASPTFRTNATYAVVDDSEAVDSALANVGDSLSTCSQYLQLNGAAIRRW